MLGTRSRVRGHPTPAGAAFMWLVVAAVFGTALSGCQAAAYYVDARQGSDANSGTSPSTPWRSLAKASSVPSGSHLYLHAGQTFTGTLTVSASEVEVSGYGTRPAGGLDDRLRCGPRNGALASSARRTEIRSASRKAPQRGWNQNTRDLPHRPPQLSSDHGGMIKQVVGYLPLPLPPSIRRLAFLHFATAAQVLADPRPALAVWRTGEDIRYHRATFAGTGTVLVTEPIGEGFLVARVESRAGLPPDGFSAAFHRRRPANPLRL